MKVASRHLNAWMVRFIDVLPVNQGVQVTFAVDGRDPVQFRTRRFGVGMRGAKSAALAKFASQAGFGEPQQLYRYLAAFPRDFVGRLFAAGTSGRY